MRILLITHCFPPLAVTASHRPYGWARAWADAGHDVHVVTPRKYAFDGDLGLDLPRDGITVHEPAYAARFVAGPAATFDAQFERAGGRDRAKADDDGRARPDPGAGAPPAPPAQRPARVDAPSNPGGYERSEPARSLPALERDGSRWSRLKRVTRRLRAAAGDFADPRVLAVPALIHTANALIRDAPFDLLVSTYGPASAHIAASRLAETTGIPWVADYQDLWSQPYGAPRRSRWRENFDVRRERRVMRRAAMFLTLSHGLAERLRDLHGRERDCEVAYFGYDDFTTIPPVSPAHPRDDRLRIVYTGRVYPGYQPIDTLFAAIGDAAIARPGLADAVAVDFYGPEQQDLRQLCERYRTQAITHFHGLVPHTRALALQRDAAATLWFDWSDAASPGVITYKLFEYLRSGTPMVAINAGIPTEASKLIESLSAGQILKSREEITRFLLTLPASLPTRPPVDERIERLSNRRQGLAILETIERKLFSPRQT